MGMKAPGRSHREDISVMELHRRFPDNAAAEKRFEALRWPDGSYCSETGSVLWRMSGSQVLGKGVMQENAGADLGRSSNAVSERLRNATRR